MQHSDKLNKTKDWLTTKVINGDFSVYDLVQLIELCILLANIDTIPNRAAKTNKTYNGIKKTYEIIDVLGVKCAANKKTISPKLKTSRSLLSQKQNAHDSNSIVRIKIERNRKSFH